MVYVYLCYHGLDYVSRLPQTGTTAFAVTAQIRVKIRQRAHCTQLQRGVFGVQKYSNIALIETIQLVNCMSAGAVFTHCSWEKSSSTNHDVVALLILRFGGPAEYETT